MSEILQTDQALRLTESEIRSRNEFLEMIHDITDRLVSTLEYRLVDPHGTTRWLHQRNVLVLGEDGNPKSIEGIITDLTDLRAAEDQRRLLQDQVQHTQKLESLGVMAGGIAHD